MKCLGRLDQSVSYTLMFGATILSFTALAGDLITLVTNFRAIDLAKVANDIVAVTVHMLAIMLWHSLCYNWKAVHAFWKFKSWLTPDLMPGGFAPRPAAFSLGFLLFVSLTLISGKVVPAATLTSAAGWPIGQQCRADGTVRVGSEKVWFSRFSRGQSTGCYGAVAYGFPYPLSEYTPHWTMATVFGPDDRFYDATFNGLMHPVVDKVIADGKVEKHVSETRLCQYQCIAWQAVAVNVMITNLGVITVGAAIVVALTDSWSQKFGYHLVHEGSSPNELRNALATTMRRTPRKSYTLCAIQMLALSRFTEVLAAKLDVDGYYTLDYYITLIWLFSMACALMLRSWNPFLCNPVIYTYTLWSKGVDKFIDRAEDPPLVKEIDLYQWMHLTAEKRAELLCSYAKRVDLDELDLVSGANFVDDADDEVAKYAISDKQKQKTKEFEEDEEGELFYKLLACFSAVFRGFSKLCFWRKTQAVEEVSAKARKTPKVFCLTHCKAEMSVKCDHPEHGQFGVRVPVSVKTGSKGRVVGKTSDGKVAVIWPAGDILQKGTPSDKELIAIVDVLDIEERSRAWLEVKQFVNEFAKKNIVNEGYSRMA